MSFDLNINNYTKNELLDLFGLPLNYDKFSLEIKENKLKDKIIKSNEIDEDIKTQTINFIFKVKNILLNNLSDKPSLNGGEIIQEKVKELYNLSYQLKPTVLEDPQEHMVQVHHKTPYLSSYPSEYFPGVINPLKKKIIKQNLNIDTRFRNNYSTSSSTNFNMVLPITMNNVLTMQLSSIELPTTYYAISKQLGNNFFTIIIDDYTNVITIPDGNYDDKGIVTVINALLEELGDRFKYVYFYVDLEYSKNTNGSAQMIIGLHNLPEGLEEFEFNINFQTDKYGEEDKSIPLPFKLGWMFGFRKGLYADNTTYTSEGIVDLFGPKYLFLVVDDYNNSVNNGFFSAFNSSMLNKNVLARICLKTATYNILNENNYNTVTTPREYFGPVNIQNLTIQLLDEYGRIIDLNSMDYSFCLTLTIVYDI